MTRHAPSMLHEYARRLGYWWILFLVLQQGQRLFLLKEAWLQEVPSSSVLAHTLLTGFRADLIVSTVAATIIAAVGSVLTCLAGWMASKPGGNSSTSSVSRLNKSGGLMALIMMLLLTIDMGYYHYAHSHLDFVFFEYLEDLLSPSQPPGDRPALSVSSSQALKQTQAEMGQVEKWAWTVTTFLTLEFALVWVWGILYRRQISPRLVRWQTLRPKASKFLLTGCLVIGLSGFNWYGPWGVQRANISNSVYYILAQNPLWYAGEVWLGTVVFDLTGGKDKLTQLMPFENALADTRALLYPDATFPDESYPFVRGPSSTHFPPLGSPVNVLLIFVEGLDRRYLGRTIDVTDDSHFKIPFIYWTQQDFSLSPSSEKSSQTIRVTPFLDDLRARSIYFEHFFSNGDQTSRALFSTFCSYFPRFGAAVMKSRYSQDFLCLPRILRDGGYWTEMVIGQNRDRNYDHIGLFLAKNGLHQLLDENAFPPTASRIGLGVSDEALFEFVADRVRALQSLPQPFFLATLTVGTHHPYRYPTQHPEVHALARHEDQYVPALRYLDLALERFFQDMQREGLFQNTIVFIMGDHGRHEGIGGSDPAGRGGHFLVPLYVWIDPSVQTQTAIAPRLVSEVASHVDVAPTILSLVNLTPPQSPFLGRDLTCTFTGPCRRPSMTYVSGAHDGAIGLIDRNAMWLYVFRRQTFFRTSLDGHHPERDQIFRPEDWQNLPPDSPFWETRRHLFALYVSSNYVLADGRVWSWKRFADSPTPSES